MTPSYRQILVDGVWVQNTGLVVLLGFCPLLAVTGTVITGLGLGLATLLTVVCTNLIVSLSRGLLRHEIRILVYVLIIATVVTAIQLVVEAWWYDLYLALGIFIPLIVTNCAITMRAETFASRHPPFAALLDGFATGLGFLLTLVLLGALRELAGHGTLLRDASLLFGAWGEGLQVTVLPGEQGFLLAILPPGAFISLGLLIAGRNWLAGRSSVQRTPDTHRDTAAEPSQERA